MQQASSSRLVAAPFYTAVNTLTGNSNNNNVSSSTSQQQQHLSSPNPATNTFFKTIAARREEITRKRSAFINRFVPIPVDSFGAPYHLRTAVPLYHKLKERDQSKILHFNPCFLSSGEVAKLLKNRTSSHLVGGGSSSENYSPSDSNQETLQREDIENLFQKDLYDVMSYNETTLFNMEDIHGMSKLVDESSSTSSPTGKNEGNNAFADYHRIWYQNRWYVAGAGNHCKPSYHNTNTNSTSSSSLSRNRSTNNDTSHLFFSHESFPEELEKHFQRRRFKSRLWCTPAALPKILAAKNGEANRIMVSYALPKKLIPGYVLEPRFDAAASSSSSSNHRAEDRYRIGRPFHFWARTGQRINFSEGDFENLHQFLRTGSQYHGSYAWFTSLDLKTFGYRVRQGEQSLMKFAEERLITCFPLCPPYVSNEQLTILNQSTSLPAPPVQNDLTVRILRNDFRWTSIPLSRVELPHDEDDAESVRQVPVADANVLTSLGIKTEMAPLVLSMKIPVSAFNVSQLVPHEQDADLPPPWIMMK